MDELGPIFIWFGTLMSGILMGLAAMGSMYSDAQRRYLRAMRWAVKYRREARRRS